MHQKSCLMRWFDKISGGSLRGSIFAVASFTFGGGCLAFPSALAKSGPVLGLIIYFFCAYISYLTSCYIVETGMKLKILDYNELVRKSVNDKMRLFADINNIILSFGVIMGYQYMAYETLQIILKDLFEIDPSNTNKLIMMGVLACIVQIPLSLIKNISILQYASLTATVCLTYTILVILFEAPFYFNQNYGKNEKYEFSIFPPDGIGYNWLNTLSTFLFGFCVHNGFFQVFMEMDRPNLRRSMKVVNRATLLEVILYFIIGVGGYLSMFYDCLDAFIKRPNLDGYKDIPMLIARITLVVILNCCMAINYNILRLAYRSMIFNNKIPSFITDFLITIGIYVFANVVVFYVKDVSTILGFAGGLNATVISFVCPILIYIKLGLPPEATAKKLLNYIFLVIICILGLLCTIKSVYDYIHDLSNDEKK